ncbi:MAG: helicase-related protein, partial [Candidatus Heimdallarchaeota archaeon]
FEYLKKLESSSKRTDKRLMKNPRIKEAVRIVEDLHKRSVEHPKLEKLLNIVKDLVRKKPDVKIIIFANYRATVEKINRLLKDNGINSEILIGQATKEKKGLSQQEQIDILRRFSEKEFNVLVGTSISEEGLDVPTVDYAIFYEPVPSEIRTIQRRGRVGRQAAGKIIFLITKKTRDEAYYWAAFHKEKKMKGILYDMKKDMKKKKTLKDWF